MSTVGDRAFPVAAARLWNSLPSHVTAVPSLSIFCCRLKSHLLSLSYPAFWFFSHLHSGCAVPRHFGHYILTFTFNINPKIWKRRKLSPDLDGDLSSTDSCWHLLYPVHMLRCRTCPCQYSLTPWGTSSDQLTHWQHNQILHWLLKE